MDRFNPLCSQPALYEGNDVINMENKSLQNRVLMITTLTAFLTPFIGNAINLAIPAIGRDLHGTVILLNWIVTAFLLLSAAFLLPFGRLADLYGRKRIFMPGLILFSAATLLCGVAGNMVHLLLYRIIQGVGAAMMFSTSVPIMVSVFPPTERGRVLGINAAAVYVGLSAGPVVGGFLTGAIGWRSIFWLVGILGVLVAAAAYYCLPEDKQQPGLAWSSPAVNLLVFLSACSLAVGSVLLMVSTAAWYPFWLVGAGLLGLIVFAVYEYQPGRSTERFDLLGALLVVFPLCYLIYGTSSLTTSSVGPYSAVIGLVGLVLFGIHEYRFAHPLLDVAVLVKNRPFAFANLSGLINYSATFSTGLLLSYYLQIVRGMPAAAAGSLLLVSPVVQAVLSPIAGRMSDRFQPRLVAGLGMTLTTFGLGILSTLAAATPIWVIIGGLISLGIGFALFASPNTNTVMSSVEKRQYGVASSTLSTMRLVGQALSMAVVAFIFAADHVGRGHLSAALAPEMLAAVKTGYMVFSGLCVLGILVTFAQGEIQRGEGKPRKA
ncbi:MAG: MFS transporter [Solirubrobacterales bacterium]